MSATEESLALLRRIAEAVEAMAFHQPVPSSKPKTAAKPGELTIPFGRNKGTPLSQAEDKDLRFVHGAMLESLNDPSKDRYRDKNAALLDAVDAELAARDISA